MPRKKQGWPSTQTLCARDVCTRPTIPGPGNGFLSSTCDVGAAPVVQPKATLNTQKEHQQTLAEAVSLTATHKL